MNLGIRAILYSARKWKKTLLVFCLLLAITTLVLSGLAIADAQEEQAEEAAGCHRGQLYRGTQHRLPVAGQTTVMVLIARRNLSLEDMIQKIASVDGIAGYDASSWQCTYLV